jgi:hypothetical protein
MACKVKPIPDGCHTVTPHLIVRGADIGDGWFPRPGCRGPRGLIGRELR